MKQGTAMTDLDANMPSFSIAHTSCRGMLAVAVYELPQRVDDGRMLMRLRRLTFNESANGQFVRAVLARVPSVVQWGEATVRPDMAPLLQSGCTVDDVTERDLSFARFWQSYGYKVGDRRRVERKWDALSDEDRLLALQGISRQRRHSDQHRTDMPYPETYLNQRRWENQF